MMEKLDDLTEERFVNIIKRIPIIEEKLNKLLFAIDRISTNGNMVGIKTDGEIALEYDADKEIEDKAKVENYQELNDKAQKLKEEADAISTELGLGGS